MNKLSKVFDIRESLLKINTSNCICSSRPKRKYHIQHTINDCKHDLEEYQHNPQGFFTHLEHWSLDGG